MLCASTYPTSEVTFRLRSTTSVVGDWATSAPRAMRPYLETSLMEAARTATIPSHRLTLRSCERTARSSADRLFQKSRTRTLSLASGLATDLGRPARLTPSLVAATGAGFAAGATLAAGAVAAPSEPAVCSVSWLFALDALTAPWAFSAILPAPLTAGLPVATFPTGVGDAGTTSSLGRRRSMYAASRPTTAITRILMGGEIWLTSPHIGRHPSDP